MPKNRLKDLEINEISFVGDGDNPEAKVLIMKKKEEEMPKNITPEEALAKEKEALAKEKEALAKEKEALAKANQKSKDKIDVSKELQERFEDLQKQKEELKTTIEKMQQEIIKKRWVEDISKISLIEDVDKTVDLFVKTESINKELSSLVYSTLKKYSEICSKSELFKEFGSKSDEPSNSLESIAKKIQQDEKVSYEVAFDKAICQNPELYKG